MNKARVFLSAGEYYVAEKMEDVVDYIRAFKFDDLRYNDGKPLKYILERPTLIEPATIEVVSVCPTIIGDQEDSRIPGMVQELRGAEGAK